MAKVKATVFHDSAESRVLVYTVDPPFKKGSPGYISREYKSHNSDAEPPFTTSIWEALALDRKDWDTMLPALKMRTRKTLFTHVAVAVLGVLEEKP